MCAKKRIETIGVLTSGGDAPGMNAALRAITRAALAKNIKVIGILKGYRGLIDNELIKFNARSVSNIITKGGTFLYSDRCDEFKTPEGMAKAVATCKKNKIDGIIAIGGDGTFRGATDLSNLGIPTIGIPATIDNDITATDYSIGFDTAMNTVVEMVDRLRDTCESHARCNVVEVMGRDAGHIAIRTAIALGAVGVAVKEMHFDEEACIDRIVKARANGKRNFIVICSEGTPEGFGERFTKDINDKINVDSRFARLAHVQRGGSPTLTDRLIATQMGSRAVDLICEGKNNLVICMQENKFVELNIQYALALDKKYKGKLSDEAFNALKPKDQKEMMRFIEERRNQMQKLYSLVAELAL